MKLKGIKINPKDWYLYGQWEQPPFSASYWVHWYNKSFFEKLKIHNLNGNLIMLGGYTIIGQHDFEESKKRLKEACDELDQKLFDNLKDASLKIYKDYFDWGKKSRKEDIVKEFSQFLQLSENVMTPWWLSVIFSDYMGDILTQKALAAGVHNIIEYVPERETPMLKQMNEACEIKKMLHRAGYLTNVGEFNFAKLNKLKKDKALWKKIREHISENDWVGTHHFWGEGLSLDKFLKDIKNYKGKKETIKKIKLDKEMNFLLNNSADVMFLRQYSAEIFDLVAYRLRDFLGLIAKKVGLNYSNLLLLTPREVLKLLENKKKITASKINSRQKDFCVAMIDKKEYVFDKKNDVNLLREIFINKEKGGASELKGAIAYKGKARGRAKIFLVPENLSKMKNGDILVTPMTTPDFVPLMKKAGAIVTDIGGLLSHAAIISRELKIPCVIGTKNATKVLKDGDLVEVDANNGVVRKLK